MRHRSGAFGRSATRLAAAGLIAASIAAFSAGAIAGEEKGTISVSITNVRSSEGVIRACLTPLAKGFPQCKAGDGSITRTVPAKSTASVTFSGVAPGRYAIALLHDENNNGKADRALMMMPTEGFGFSRDAKVRMGPPKFDDAAFDVTADKQSQTIRMRYML